MNDVPGTRTPDISVVLATYDRRHSLPRAIAQRAGAEWRSFRADRGSMMARATARRLSRNALRPGIRAITAERNSGPKRGA